jgi:hypothetical protein
MKFPKTVPINDKPVLALVEALAITGMAVVAGFIFFPEDPFFIHAPFPWIWIASVMIALRYGFALSLLSVIVIATAFTAAQTYGAVSPGYPKAFFIGGLMLTMLCGQFSTIWSGRIRRASQLSEYSEERLEQISRAYYMLRLSHDRMEQNLILKPVTLRGALEDLRRLLSLHGGELNPDIGKRFLSLLSQYCSLENASLHLIEGEAVLETPIAAIGQVSPFSLHDELVVRALEQGVMNYSAVNELTPGEQSSYLVAAPFRVSNGAMVGLLLVEKMPFLSLNRENLQVLGVLLGYFADQFHAVSGAGALLESHPDCPPTFASETIKLSRLKRDFDIDSAIVSIGLFPSPQREQVMARLQRQQRGLDYIWQTRHNDLELIVTLMPFAGTVAVEGYFARVATTLKNDFGLTLDDPLVRSRSTLIPAGDCSTLYGMVTGTGS